MLFSSFVSVKVTLNSRIYFIKLLLDATVLVDTITYFTCLSQKLFYVLQD